MWSLVRRDRKVDRDMTLSIHGNHCNLGEALKEHAVQKMQTISEKYFGRALDATVTFSKTENKGFRANIVNHVGNRVYQADAVGRNAHMALEIAADKLAKQLRRTKTRVRDDHHAREKAQLEQAVLA